MKSPDVVARVVDQTKDVNEILGIRTETSSQKEIHPKAAMIKKMLDLALHFSTPDTEAEQAMANAQRMMRKYNLEQAEVMQEMKNEGNLTAGVRVVCFRSLSKPMKAPVVYEWFKDLAGVVSDFFESLFYWTWGPNCHGKIFVFYGIKQNAEIAAYAFEAVFNRICHKSLSFKPITKDEFTKGAQRNVTYASYSRSARTHYRNGLVDGLREAVETTKLEQAMAKNQERALQLYEHSKAVGKELLASNGIKISEAKKARASKNWDQKAYDQGKVDSKDLNLNQKSIRNKQKRLTAR